jgi:hypothetical protein
MIINLFYLSPNTTGGWVTFTAHLMMSLREQGHEVYLFKIGNNSELNDRPFGYGIKYRNVTADEAVRVAKFKDRKSLVVAVQKNYAEVSEALLSVGAKAVLHDPTELRAGFALRAPVAPWVIRRAVLRQVPGSVFIRHPYVRRPAPPKLPKKRGAVSTSRIDFDKHTEIILDANRLGAGIEIRGFENRLYTKFKIMPKYPEWVQSVAAYPRDADAAYELLLKAKFMVDMSLIKGDGGGTQYTFLEAWDAGAVPIIHVDWILPKDDMVVAGNCLVASDGAHLASVLKQATGATIAPLVEAGYKSLRRHAPKIIVPQVVEWLNAR